MSALRDKLIKNSTIKETAILTESKFFGQKEEITTEVYGLNIAFSGRLDGGFVPGLSLIAGPSKHFKTAFLLLSIRAFQKRHPNGIVLFYDSEFGSPPPYFKSFGINIDNVVHTPVKNLEELKFDIMQQLDLIDNKDEVMIAIDSLGNLASKKEVDDALDGKSVADMTRARVMKGLFRMVTPYLTIKNIPMFSIMHTYDTIEMYSKQVVSGGKGAYYSADTIFIIGRQQEKDGTELAGYNFIINIEKSRFVKEKSKIPITVTYEGGINRWSGLLDLASEGGFVNKVRKRGYVYNRIDPITGEIDPTDFTEKQTYSSEFWTPIVNNQKFKDYIANKYQVSHGDILKDEDDIEEVFDRLEDND